MLDAVPSEKLLLNKQGISLSKTLFTPGLILPEKVEIISIETEEGDQFFNLGGIGSILRFRV